MSFAVDIHIDIFSGGIMAVVVWAYARVNICVQVSVSVSVSSRMSMSMSMSMNMMRVSIDLITGKTQDLALRLSIPPIS